jgi:hypothetical protein
MLISLLIAFGYTLVMMIISSQDVIPHPWGHPLVLMLLGTAGCLAIGIFMGEDESVCQCPDCTPFLYAAMLIFLLALVLAVMYILSYVIGGILSGTFVYGTLL